MTVRASLCYVAVIPSQSGVELMFTTLCASLQRVAEALHSGHPQPQLYHHSPTSLMNMQRIAMLC